MTPTNFQDIDRGFRLDAANPTSLETIDRAGVRNVTRVRQRSGLSTAAGFAGLALIFSRFSLAPLLWAQFPRMFDISNPYEAFLSKIFLLSIPLPGLVAPVALILGIKAWVDLNRHTEKCGRLQAGFAFLIGLVGTLIVATEIYQVAKALMTPI